MSATPTVVPQPGRPTPVPALRAAAVIAVVLGVCWLGMGGFEATQTRLSRVAVGGGAAVVMIAYGLGYLAIAWGLRRRSRFARGPAMAMALIQVPIAWSFLRTPADGSPAGVALFVGLALGVVSIALAVLLVLPSSTRALFPATNSESGSDHLG